MVSFTSSSTLGSNLSHNSSVSSRILSVGGSLSFSTWSASNRSVCPKFSQVAAICPANVTSDSLLLLLLSTISDNQFIPFSSLLCSFLERWIGMMYSEGKGSQRQLAKELLWTHTVKHRCTPYNYTTARQY